MYTPTSTTRIVNDAAHLERTFQQFQNQNGGSLDMFIREDGSYQITLTPLIMSNQELGWTWLKAAAGAGLTAVCYAGTLAWKSRILAAGTLFFFGLGIWQLSKAVYHTAYKALVFLTDLCRS